MSSTEEFKETPAPQTPHNQSNGLQDQPPPPSDHTDSPHTEDLEDPPDDSEEDDDQPEDEEDGEDEDESARYSMVRVIRDTGQGAVYLAIDEIQSRYVVLKRCLWKCVRAGRDLTGNPVHEDALKELFLMKMLCYGPTAHPYLLRLHESFSDPQALWLVLECASEGDLLEKIQACRGKPLPTPFARRIFRQIVEALAFLAERGIAHMDVSPDNVLLVAGTAKLADFGLSIIVLDPPSGQTSLDAAHQPINFGPGRPGKPQYMAPELFFSGKCVPAQADMYSAGVVLFNMLFARAPYSFPGDEFFKMIYGKSAKELKQLLSSGNSPDENDENDLFDLLSNLICPPEQRLQAKDLLKHPWISSKHFTSELAEKKED